MRALVPVLLMGQEREEADGVHDDHREEVDRHFGVERELRRERADDADGELGERRYAASGRCSGDYDSKH